MVREEVERHRGRYVKSLGDGALAVFDGPSRAISSALAIRDGLGALGLEVRCRPAHRRVRAARGRRRRRSRGPHRRAHQRARRAGEVLVSSTVRDLVVGSGQTLTDRGEHELKGVPGPWRIFAVDAGEGRGPE